MIYFLLLALVLTASAQTCDDFFEDLKWEINQHDENHHTAYPVIISTSSNMLSLSNVRIDKLPDSLANCASTMTSITISSCKLQSVGSGFAKLNLLTSINLSNNKLRSVPNFTGMRDLLSVNLSKNFLTALPTVPNSPLIHTYHAAYNQITTIPAGIAKTKIDSLNLSYNHITSSKLTEGLSVLRNLDLSYNKLKSIPSFVDSCHNLGTLNVASNDISGSISNDFSALVALTEINLSRNKITALPPKFYVDSVTIFNADYNMLTAVEMAQMPLINSFSVAHNMLTALPKFSPHSNEMSLIDARGNKITAAGIQDMGELTASEVLLGGNSLSAKPANLYKMKIQKLDLSYNSLTVDHLPTAEDRIIKVNALTTLNLRNNKLSSFAWKLCETATNLKTLNLDGNTIKEFTSEAASCSFSKFTISSNELKKLINMPAVSTQFDAANNEIDSLENNKCTSCNANLAFNKITKLENTGNFASLDVSFNSITSIGTGTAVDTLYLDGNNLSGITFGVSHELTLVNHLYMRGCNLAAVPNHAFIPNQNIPEDPNHPEIYIQTVDMSHNAFSTALIPKDYGMKSFTCRNCHFSSFEVADPDGEPNAHHKDGIETLDLSNVDFESVLEDYQNRYSPAVPAKTVSDRLFKKSTSTNAVTKAFWYKLPTSLTNLYVSNAVAEYADVIGTDALKAQVLQVDKLKVLDLSNNGAKVSDVCGRFAFASKPEINIMGSDARIEGCFYEIQPSVFKFNVRDNFSEILNMNMKNGYLSVYPFRNVKIAVDMFHDELCDLGFVQTIDISGVTDVGKVFNTRCVEMLSKTSLTGVTLRTTKPQDNLTGVSDQTLLKMYGKTVTLAKGSVTGRSLVSTGSNCILDKTLASIRLDKTCKFDNQGSGYTNKIFA